MQKAKIALKEKIKSLVASKKSEWCNVIGVVIHEAWNAQWEKVLEDIGTNVITNTWLAELANLSGNESSPVAFTYLANGSGNTAADATDTALWTENTTNGSARAAATVTRETTTVTNDTLQLVKSWSLSGAVTVEEVGVFNAASSGIMLARQVTSSKTFGNGDTYQVTYQIIFA